MTASRAEPHLNGDFPWATLDADPAVYATVRAEIGQQDDFEAIASENYVSRAVLDALGSPLTNKYAEGLPNRRYYGGCEHVDEVENIARRRARELFMVEGCDIGVNVQPHAGAQANQAVFLYALEAGDTILGLDLSHGGHLTHEALNSSVLYTAAHYGVQTDASTWIGSVTRRHRHDRSCSLRASASRGSSTSRPSSPSRTRSARS